jgi:uracil-DNA glycosylase family 4
MDKLSISIDDLNQINDLAELKEWTKDCTACGLRQESDQVTHSSGPLTSPILFVGMNPGFCEDATGIPFCGRAELATSRCVSCVNYTTCYSWQTDLGAARPLTAGCLGHTPLPPGTPNHIPPASVLAGPFRIGGLRSAGQLLDDALAALKIDRNQILITNSALCKSKSGEPKPQYVNRCSSIRVRTEQLLKPKVIVAFGRLAIGQYTGKAVTLSRVHGVPFDYTIGLPDGATHTAIVVPTYHPSAILRKMLHASQESLTDRARTAEIVAQEKWHLYNDLAAAFNLLDPTQLQTFLLPGETLENGRLRTKVK